MDETQKESINIPITSVEQITKAFNNTMKSMEKVDKSQIKKSVAIYSDITKYIGVFLKSTMDMMKIIKENMDDSINEQQIKLVESTVKIIESSIKIVETLGNMKFPSMLKLRLKLLKFKIEFGMVLDMFLNPSDGIAAIINRLDKGGVVQTKDKNGKVTNEFQFNKGGLIKSTNAAVKSISDMIEGIRSIIAVCSSLSRNILLNFLIIKIGLSLISKKNGLLDMIYSVVGSDSFKQLSYKKTQNLINKTIETLVVISNLLDGLREVFGKIDASLVRSAAVASRNINKVLNCATIIVTSLASWSESLQDVSVAEVSDKLKIVKQTVDSLLSMIGGIVLLALALPAVVLATPLAIVTVATMKLFIYTVIWVLKPLQNAQFTRSMVMSCSNLLKMVGLILATMALTLVGLTALALIGIHMGDIWKDAVRPFGIALGVVMLLALVGWTIDKIFMKSKFGRSVWDGMLMIIALIGLMLVVGTSLILVSMIGKSLWENKEHIFHAFLIIIAVLGLMVLLGLAAKYVLPFFLAATAAIALTALSITMILIILGELKLLALAVFDFDEDQRQRIKEHVKIVINTALDVITSMFFDNDDLDGDARKQASKTKNSPFRRFFSSLFKGGAMMIEALCASVILIFTTVSLAMILLIVLEMKGLEKLTPPNRKTVHDNIHAVMGAAHDCIQAVFFNDEDVRADTSNDWLTPMLNRVLKGTTDLIVLVLALGKIALTMVAIGMLLLVEQELKALNSTKVNEGAVRSSVSTIMSAAQTCIDAVVAPMDKVQDDTGNTNWLKSVLTKVVHEGADFVKSLLSIGKLALTFAAVGLMIIIKKELENIEQTNLNVKTIEKKVSDIMSTAKVVVESVFDDNKGLFSIKKYVSKANDLIGITSLFTVTADSLSQIVKSVNSVNDLNGEGFERGINNSIKFVREISNIKLENLQSATNMFAKMAELSQSINGNFEGLAEVLNEKILEVLEQLNTTLGDTNLKIEDLKNASEAISGAVVTDSNGNTSVSSSSSFSPSDRIRLSNIERGITDLVDAIAGVSTSPDSGDNRIRVTTGD